MFCGMDIAAFSPPWRGLELEYPAALQYLWVECSGGLQHLAHGVLFAPRFHMHDEQFPGRSSRCSPCASRFAVLWPERCAPAALALRKVFSISRYFRLSMRFNVCQNSSQNVVSALYTRLAAPLSIR